MPKRKQKIYKKKTRRSHKLKQQIAQSVVYQTLMRRPETVIGLIVIAVFGLALLISSVATVRKSFAEDTGTAHFAQRTYTQTINPVSTPAASLTTASDSALFVPSPTLVPTPTATTTAQPAQRVTVKKDQTFWELAKRYCGSHTFAETLARNNGYKSVSKLRQGDSITINCISR